MAKSAVKKKVVGKSKRVPGANSFKSAADNARWLKAVNLFIGNGADDAGQAMLKAGFSQSTATKQCQLLKKHPVYLKWVETKTKKNVVSKEYLNEKLLRWASSNVTDYFDFGNFAVAKGKETQYRFITIKNLKELPREITDCISEIQETNNGIKIKLIDKLAAVAKLAEINGLLAPQKLEGKFDLTRTEHIIMELYKMEKAEKVQEFSDSKNRIKKHLKS